MDIVHLLAPNPGLYTGDGTNTYLVGDEREVVVIDPGPIEAQHRDRIVAAVGGRRTIGVIVTHTHSDHAPLANPLGRDLGAPTLGFAAGPQFDPSEVVEEGDTITIAGQQLEVLYTPGHADDHICLLLGTTMFSGDHIIGGSTVMIEDLTRYLASLERLRTVELSKLMPGHGPQIDNPQEVIDHYISHRLEREREIVKAVAVGAGSVGAVVSAVYADIPSELHRIAAFSVAAHLRKLVEDQVVTFTDSDGSDLWDALVKLVRV